MQNTENEEFVQCPFEASHSILKQHLEVHLVRCKRQHKNSNLMLCPFNATHFMMEEELKEHVNFCPNRSSYESFQKCDTGTGRSRPLPPQPVMPKFPNSEDWTDDAEERYDPTEYATNVPVLRTMVGGSKKEKKSFRKDERARLLHLRQMSLKK